MTTELRKLATFMFTDIVGYSALAQTNDALAAELLAEHREILRPIFANYRGRELDAVGDGFLVEFTSAVDAARCAIAVQQRLQERNAAVRPDRKVQVRIGLHLGDVVVRDGRAQGDGVNIAARIEPLAEPGGICVSEDVARQIQNRIDLSVRKLGKGELKNIRLPVDIYRLVLPGERRYLPFSERVAFALRQRRARRIATLVGAVVLVLGAFGGAYFWQRRQAVEDPVLALPKGPSIAVLPFANLSGDPAQEYFSDGLTEDLITGLSRFRDLFVIGRNTTFQYKGQAVDIRKVGRDLGARYVVEGSVRRGGNTVRVNAQLLDAKSGKHLWAETFDRELRVAQLLALQDEITAQIIGAIAGSYGVISRTRREETIAAKTSNLEAYDCVLQAYAYEHILSPEVHAATRDCLERAVKLDPAYADAWSKLAFVYADEYAWGYNPRPGSLDRALEAAQRAVELDPSSGMAHWHLARTHFWRNEVEEALTEAERALALNPNNAFVLAAAAAYMAPTGGDNLKRAVQLASKALRIDPNPPGWYYFPQIDFHYDKREYEAALVASLKVNIPKFYWTYVWRSAIYGQLGRSADAAASNGRLLQLYPTFAKNARRELKKLNVNPALADHIIDGLRKAGLEIPPETR